MRRTSRPIVRLSNVLNERVAEWMQFFRSLIESLISRDVI